MNVSLLFTFATRKYSSLGSWGTNSVLFYSFWKLLLFDSSEGAVISKPMIRIYDKNDRESWSSDYKPSALFVDPGAGKRANLNDNPYRSWLVPRRIWQPLAYN